MPRTKQQTLRVHPRPALKKNHLYRVRVQESHVNKKADTLDVTCVHTQRPQIGRPHNFRLDLPLYPDSPASRFLVACGLDADHVGSEVQVDDSIGMVIGMKLPAGDFDETAVVFERVAQDTKNLDGKADTQQPSRANQ